jgi:hypothetical protein
MLVTGRYFRYRLIGNGDDLVRKLVLSSPRALLIDRKIFVMIVRICPVVLSSPANSPARQQKLSGKLPT